MSIRAPSGLRQPARQWRPLAVVRSGLLASSVLAASWAGGVMTSSPIKAQVAPVPPLGRVVNPPRAGHQILVFPQRDFVSAQGYDADDRVVVSVFHPTSGVVISTDPGSPIAPVQDPRAAVDAPFAGIIEVNHPGGSCWFQTTPDIRAGDLVRFTVVAGPDAGTTDETTVADVTNRAPVRTAPDTIQVHGTAKNADGTPIDIAQIEQRLVANQDAFDANGRRTLRANSAPVKLGDGLLQYDSPGSTNWTATYSGLDAADVARALGAEARILWLSATPAAPLPPDGTIYEVGAGVLPGPAGPQCTAPLEKLPPPPGTELIPPSAPTNLEAIVTNNNTVTLNWVASTDNVGVTSYGIYRDSGNGGAVPIFNVENPDGSAPAPTMFVDRNVPPGAYTYTVDAADAVGNRSGMSNAVNATTHLQTVGLPAGTVVHDPPQAPVQIISFPSRDFISSSGFDPSDRVDVQLLRNVDGAGLVLVSSSAGVIPQADPRAAPGDPFAGIVEVNHPGGACWEGVTPDIRNGDIVRTIAYRPDGSIRTVDETVTANVTVTRTGVEVKNASTQFTLDGVLKVHGQAMKADGSPIPTDQFEERMVANRDLFDLNGRRTIRAGGAGKDGVLTFDADDPSGTHWTATYSGLNQNDINRIMGLGGFPGAEFRSLWLGSQPLAALELTIYENDPSAIANGPSVPPCSAASEPFDIAGPSKPGLSGTIDINTNTVTLTWSAASDTTNGTLPGTIAGYTVTRDGTRIASFGPNVLSFKDTNVTVGPHSYTVEAFDTASPANGAPIGQNQEWGNRTASDAFSIGVTDITAPSVPANLVGTTDGANVTLTWSASRDDVGVTGYTVYRDGVALSPAVTGTPPATTFTDQNLQNRTYRYTVDAFDAAGHHSAQSTAATVTVAVDTIAPTTPGNFKAAAIDIHKRDIQLSWTASTDKVGTPDQAASLPNVAPTTYGIYRNGTKIADVDNTVLSYRDLSLASGTYSYEVDAADSAGNRSARAPVAPATATVTIANDPPPAPHSLLAFPARDFVSSTGIEQATNVETWRLVGTTWTRIADSTTVTPVGGVVEINHPGGGCWTGVTPNLQNGDIVRFKYADGTADQTTVFNVAAERPYQSAPGTVVVKGTAGKNPDGTPATSAQVENRLIANKQTFAATGKRTLRAGGAGADGTFSIDSNGNWIATYTGLSTGDVAMALDAESRGIWLGRDPVALSEQTIFENGPGVVGGPAGAPDCTTPLEQPTPAVSLTPASVDFGSQTVNAGFGAAHTVTLASAGGLPLTLRDIYLAGANPTDFKIDSTTCAGSIAAGASCTVSLRFNPTASDARSASLNFMDDAANTTFQTIPLTGVGTTLIGAQLKVSNVTTKFAQTGAVATNAPLADNTIPVTVGWAFSGSVDSYVIQLSTNGGAFTTIPATITTDSAAGTATTTVPLAMGPTAGNAYQFQVHACDATGNCGAWGTGQKFTLVANDDNSGFSYVGNWSGKKVASAYNASEHQSSTSGATASLGGATKQTAITVQGGNGGFAVVASKAVKGGSLKVELLSGNAVVQAPITVSLAAAAPSPAQVVATINGLAPGNYWVRLTVVGANLADVDAVVTMK